MVDLGTPPEITPEGIENAKETILGIEGLLFYLNNATASLRFAEAGLTGAGFLQAMHKELIDKIGPEEVKKMRETHKSNIPPPPAPKAS